MSRIAKTVGIALVIAIVAVVAVAGTAYAAGTGNGQSTCGDCPQYLQSQWGADNSHGNGQPGDGTGPGLQRCFGQS